MVTHFLYTCVAFDVARLCVEHDKRNKSLMSNAFMITLYLTFEKDDVNISTKVVECS
jgi:hypothetical protein